MSIRRPDNALGDVPGVKPLRLSLQRDSSDHLLLQPELYSLHPAKPVDSHRDLPDCDYCLHLGELHYLAVLQSELGPHHHQWIHLAFRQHRLRLPDGSSPLIQQENRDFARLLIRLLLFEGETVRSAVQAQKLRLCGGELSHFLLLLLLHLRLRQRLPLRRDLLHLPLSPAGLPLLGLVQGVFGCQILCRVSGRKAP